jgi:hypothetical protein
MTDREKWKDIVRQAKAVVPVEEEVASPLNYMFRPN